MTRVEGDVRAARTHSAIGSPGRKLELAAPSKVQKNDAVKKPASSSKRREEVTQVKSGVASVACAEGRTQRGLRTQQWRYWFCLKMAQHPYRVGVSRASAVSIVTVIVFRRTRLSTYGDQASPVSASRVWNNLPHHVITASSLPVFCSSSKTHF